MIMDSTIEQIFRLFNLDPCKKYKTHEDLYKGLKAKKTDAIQCLMLKSRPSVAFLVKQTGLSETYIDDILHESILILLKKIDTGKYEFIGQPPSTYVIETAKWVTLNFSRKNVARPFDLLLEEHLQMEDVENIDSIQSKRDQLDQLETMLNTLENPCKDIISLHYLEELSDKEVIDRQLVSISSINSLKARRSQCMKKLREMANGLKNKSIIL
jgi:RNA polymerase sigma factor (sigma-70 family)